MSIIIAQSVISQSIELSFQDCVVNSGIDIDIYELNFEPLTSLELYDLLYRDTDPTTNSGGSAQAKRNYTKCEQSIGWGANGRYRQLAGPPIAYDKKGRPRKYHQPQGKPLEIFCALVTVRIWRLVAAKAGLSMPDMPAVGINGEAIGFWDWAVSSGCPIVITEGEKKAAALISRGYAAIGLPGIHTGYRVTERGEIVRKPDGTEYQRALARELHTTLQALDTAGREITILFDYRAGDYSQSQEFKAASTLSKLFKSAIAKIAQLPGPDKGVDDFCVAGGDIDLVIAEASQQVSEDWQLKKWQRFRGFSPDIKINSKYFDAPAPESGKITAIKSGLGTGKTHWAGNKIASDTRGLQINLGYRNSLLLQQCEKFGSYHFDEHNGWQHIKDPDARLSLCVDSLLKLPIEMFENSIEHVRGATIILDESVSVVKHLLQSRTLLGKRVETLERLEIICKLADRVILMDGNQSDMIVNYIAEISGKLSTKIQNIYQGETPPIFFVEAGRKAKKWLSAQIVKSPRPAIATDSLRDAEAFARELAESHGPGILLTSKTAPTKDIKEFLKDPDAWIKKNKPAWIVFTPTAESGIDISIRDYFSDVFCWFVGVVGVDESVQMSRRVRHPERIVMLCPERGLKIQARSAAGILEAEVIKALAEFSDTEAQLLVNDKSQLQKLREDVAAQIIGPHMILLGKLQAKAELERSHLREYLLKAFEADGYSVQSVTADECNYDGHVLAKEECKDIEVQEIFNAPDITLSEALEIKLNFKATWDDRCRAIKFFLKARLPGIENSSLWNWQFVRRVRFDDRSLLSQLDADWIYQNPEDAEFLQQHRLSVRNREFLGDFSTRWLKIKALKSMGLEQFLEPGKAWTHESPEVLLLLKLCKKKAIANLFGHPGKMKPIQCLQKMLQLIGRKLIGKNVKQNGVQRREYSFIAESSLPPNWLELTAFTAENQARKISEIKEAGTLAAQRLEAVENPPVFYINSGKDTTSELEAPPELPPELPTLTPIANWTGWVNRWGQWVEARVIGWCEHGTRYVVEFLQASGDIGEMLVFPERFHPA